MKKFLVFFFAALLALGLASAAQGETALDLTEKCTITLAGKKNVKNLTDRKFTSFQETKSIKNPDLTVQSGTPLYGLYLCFQKKPESYLIQTDSGSGWETAASGHPDFYHVFYPLDGVQKVRVIAEGDKKQVMGFNEVYLFGEGTVPEWVQQWEETPRKADLLFVTAHPEEELLFLGGAIPWYAAERQRTVALACFSYVNTTRRSELLNGLWSMGYRYYPVIGTFSASNAKSVKAAYSAADKKKGEERVLTWLTGVIRSCRPEVIVGPDEAGEGGNGQRMMLADACVKCFALSAQENAYPGEGGEAWQAKKLYLHLYGSEEKQTVMDWEKPLASMSGLSGKNLAYRAYLYHKTQDDQDKTVFGTGKTYRYDHFGLRESTVGEDEARNDFLEHIPETELQEAHAPVKADGWNLSEVPGLPDLNEKGFLTEGEFIWSDDAHGHYVYLNSTVRIVIQRKTDGSLPLTWFETDILCDVEAGERMVNLEYTPEKKVGKKSRVDAAENAVKNRLVFAVNGDYYTYRVGSKNGHPVGVEIRDGVVYFDDRYDHEENKFFPNLDTLAFYMDGSVDVHHSVEMSAKDYLDRGAYLVYSFGPYLVRDGALSEWVQDPTKSRAKNPRHSFGMIEPGHYVDIMCEGRLGSRSEGVTMPQLALLAQAAGCVNACDLDGGQTAVVVFMGKQLNRIGKYNGKTSARETCEVLGIGFSDQVGHYQIQ